MKHLLTFFFAAASFSAIAQAQSGPIIEKYGAVYDIEDADFTADPNRWYRVVFDVAESPGGPAEVNALINTVARFLNMHARAGVPRERMQVAFVLHGGGAKDALNDEAYRRRFQTHNPNRELLEALQAAGVDIYLCGQSAHFRGFSREELAAPVKVALSAMTVLVTLQTDGYQLIRF